MKQTESHIALSDADDRFQSHHLPCVLPSSCPNENHPGSNKVTCTLLPLDLEQISGCIVKSIYEDSQSLT